MRSVSVDSAQPSNVHRRSIRRYHAKGLLNLMSQDVFSGAKIIKKALAVTRFRPERDWEGYCVST